jgi:hypothetical protein
MWNHLKPQLSEVIADLHNKGWTDAELLEKLNNREYWVTLEPFRSEVFNYENAKFTLLELSNIFEMVTGSDTAFLNELNSHVRSLLNVEYEAEVTVAEGQRELVWVFNQSMERRGIA